jgi:formate/nitrite transporter FocA (FNT family)
VLCNLLVCLAIWLYFCATNAATKAAMLILPVAMFVSSGFEHSVANMFMVPLGNCVEKINIVIKPEWFNARLELSSDDSLWAFLNADKSHQIINIDQNILSLIQPILDMRKPQSLTETLMFESHALQVMPWFLNR